MQLGLMFFAADDSGAGDDRYRLLLSAARLADSAGLHAIWTPERHFHGFGGRFPNPAVTGAALAVTTTRLRIRAGSVVSPLHNTIRLAEDWAVVDNLSGGRVDLSFGAGWNADDFVLWPERYQGRREVMYAQIEMIRKLWRGESIVARNGQGNEVTIALAPRPVQPDLPTWVTSSSSPDTFRLAGRIGANVLTHLMFQDEDALVDNVSRYREARRAVGLDPEAGTVTLMLHTHLSTDATGLRDLVRAPLRGYLLSAIELERRAARGGGRVSGGRALTTANLSARLLEQLADIAFERYFATASLIGTPDQCLARALRFASLGVNEVACLVDFGLPDAHVLESVSLLGGLQRRLAPAEP